jgi:hypothetical protein
MKNVIVPPGATFVALGWMAIGLEDGPMPLPPHDMARNPSANAMSLRAIIPPERSVAYLGMKRVGFGPRAELANGSTA